MQILSKYSSTLMFIIVLGILCNFFNVLPIRLKICRSLFSFLFYNAKYARPKDWARLRGFSRSSVPDQHQARNFSRSIYSFILFKFFFKMCVIPKIFCMRKFKTQEDTYYLHNITIAPREIVFIIIVRICDVVSNKSEHNYSPNTYFSAYAFMKNSSLRSCH